MDSHAHGALGGTDRTEHRSTRRAHSVREATSGDGGYRSCLGIIRLAERYSATRMEAAAQRALETNACRFKSAESILKNSLDQQPLTQLPSLPPPPPHNNIRGGEYFE